MLKSFFSLNNIYCQIIYRIRNLYEKKQTYFYKVLKQLVQLMHYHSQFYYYFTVMYEF